MKKLFVAMLTAGFLITTSCYAQNASGPNQSSMDPSSGYGYGGGDACCAQPCDQSTGDCWCKYVHYQPCYYNVWRCCEEAVPYKKKCCRYVPKYYEVQRCRYVPQYYTETCCCYVPEYYCVDECRTCKKWYCEKQCKWVPRYYYKHVCKDNNACCR